MPGILDRLRAAAAYAEQKKVEAQVKVQQMAGGGYAKTQREQAFDQAKQSVQDKVNGAIVDHMAEHPNGYVAKATEVLGKAFKVKAPLPDKREPEPRDEGEL